MYLNSITMASDGGTNRKPMGTVKIKTNICGILKSFRSKNWDDDICMSSRIGLAVCRWIFGTTLKWSTTVSSMHIKTDTICGPCADASGLHKLSIFDIRKLAMLRTMAVRPTDWNRCDKYQHSARVEFLRPLKWILDDVMLERNKY